MKSIGIILIVILLFPSPAYSQEWASFESEHYIFYYIEGYFSRQELKNIADTQEDIFDFVTNSLKTEYNERIEYYLHPSREEFASFAGGYACRSGEVHWLCKKCGVEYCKQWKGDPHEITHILSFEIGVPSLLFVEGLAVYVANIYFGRESHQYSKFLLENDSIVLPRDLLSTFGDHDLTLSYSEAGSFVAFMIESYGIEKFLRFYSESPEDLESVEMNMKSTYGKSFGDLEDEWISSLQKYELDVPEIRGYRETIERSGEVYSDYMEFARIPGHYSEDIECDFVYFWGNSVKNFEKAKETLERTARKVETLNQAYSRLIKAKIHLFKEGTYDEITAELETIKEMFGKVGAWTVAEKMGVYINAFELMRGGENDLEAKNYSEARMKFAEARTLFGELEEYSQETKAQDLMQVCSKNLERERARIDLYLIVAVAILTAGFITLKWKKERV